MLGCDGERGGVPSVAVLIVVSLPSVYHAVNLTLFGKDLHLRIVCCFVSLVRHVNWLVPSCRCSTLIRSSSLWCHFVTSTRPHQSMSFLPREQVIVKEKKEFPLSPT